MRWLRMIGREIADGSIAGAPMYQLTDAYPEGYHMLHDYPELRCYRDIAFYWKWFLNPDRVVFPNATQTLHLPTNPMKASEIPLDIACPFRPTPDTLAVLYYAKRATKASLTGGDDSPLGALLSSEIFQGWS